MERHRGAFHGGYEAEMLPHELKQAPKDASGWQRRVPNSCEATRATSRTGTEEGQEALDRGDRGDRKGLPHAPCSPVTRGVWQAGAGALQSAL